MDFQWPLRVQKSTPTLDIKQLTQGTDMEEWINSLTFSGGVRFCTLGRARKWLPVRGSTIEFPLTLPRVPASKT